MGIEPYFVAGSLEGVLAQRLVRRLCPDCKQPYEPTEPELAEVGVRRAEAVGRTLYRAAGCGECRGTGYRGRVGLYELLLVDEVIGDLVLRRASSRAIKDAAQERGMVTLREEGWRSVCDGITSIEEIGRVTHEDEVALGVGDDDARAG
jgi:type II secretory ATPase GspE/PulE/Tfp pilus assembly ATPase PilB-like protein